MNAIQFHAQHGEDSNTATVQPSESHKFADIINNIGKAFLQPAWNQDILRKAITAENSLSQETRDIVRWAEQFTTEFNNKEFHLVVEEQVLDSYNINLNTVQSVGNSSMKLLARLHHATRMWVAAEDTNWVADIIQDAHPDIFQKDKGWLDVITLLRQNNTVPVIVTNNNNSWNWNTDKVAELTFEQQLTPHTWESYMYGHGYDALTVIRKLSQRK